MADIKKFLDKDGVSLLWSKVVEEANRAKAAEEANAGKITVLEGKVEALEVGTYDDTEIRNLIAGVDAKADGAQSTAETADGKAVTAQNAVNALTNRVSVNEGTLAILNGNAETENSVDYKIAQAVAAIMENPDDTMNSINELVNWINDHADDALALSNQVTTNKNDIAALQTGKQDVIPAGTYDTFGAANNALNEANAYTDSALDTRALTEAEILAIIDPTED